jgi:NitT/TauT family transport system substrate-binding protein
LVGGGLVAAPVVRAQEEVVRVADLLAISNAGVYLAIERGFFREQGIRNEVSTFASAAKVLPALASGEMEVAAGSPSAGFFNGVAQGATFRIVADKGQNRPGTGFTMLTVRRDLVESGRVKTVRDLKGRRVSLFAKGISQHYYAGRNLDDSPEETA